VFTVNVFSYLYKYLYKGPDTAFFAVDDIIPSDGPMPVNEINDYQKGRYLSAPEACWHILEFEVTRKEPAVESLLIHLPGRNVPQFRQHDGVRSSTSLLQRYFLRAEELSHLRYEDYYEQFVLYLYHDEDELQDHDHLEKPCHGVVRKKASCRVHIDKVTCINTVSIRSGEVFYLRMLLLHHPARSFQDLRTVAGMRFNSFHEAACDIGLFDNQNEGQLALCEAVDSLRTPSQLRFLFSQIILEGYAAMALWMEFRQPLSIDHMERIGNEDLGYECMLQNIDDQLSQCGRHLADFGLPSPQRRSIELLNEEIYLRNNSASFTAEKNNMCQQLNEQHRIFDHIRNAIHSQCDCVVFIKGRPVWGTPHR